MGDFASFFAHLLTSVAFLIGLSKSHVIRHAQNERARLAGSNVAEGAANFYKNFWPREDVGVLAGPRISRVDELLIPSM